MDIAVEFDGTKWSVNPNVAEVKVGERVQWIVRWRVSSTLYVRWSVVFGPSKVLHRLETTTRNVGLGTASKFIPSGPPQSSGPHGDQKSDEFCDHNGVVGPVVADRPGDYKYDIRASNAQNDEDIGEDDPTLIVRA
jgi:hypothetical protein